MNALIRTTSAAAAIVAITLAATAASARAQVLGVPVALDARVEVAFPLGDFGDIADTGIGGTLSVALPLVPAFGIYGSYTQIRFGGGWTGDGVSDATTDGFTVGLTTTLPGTLDVDPWIGAGLLLHRLEVRGTRQGVSNDLGFEVGAGVAVPLADRLRLTPAVHYRHFGASIPALAGLTARSLTVQYLSLGVGLNYWF
jgi:opacity protein-like surface antigen